MSPTPKFAFPGPASREQSAAGLAHPWGWWETLALAGYLAVVGTGVYWHEAWADEAQAWLMARDMSWPVLIGHGVRYEGSPGLWHSLLWLLIRLHVSFAGMHWVAAALAASAVVVLLRYAPFPRVLRLLLPFTFFLAYQDAVVARSYILFGVLAFGAAALLRRRSQHHVRLAVLLGLMANVSVHGLIASVALAAVALVQHGRAHSGKRPLAAAAVLACFWVAAVATTLPPKDVNFPAGRNISQSWKKIEAQVQRLPVQEQREVTRPGELAPMVFAQPHRTFRQDAWRKIARLLSLITFPLSSIRILALAAFAAVLAHALTLKRDAPVGRIGLLPYLVLIVFFLSLYIAPRHTGILFITFLVTAWLTWPAASERKGWSLALTTLLLLITAQQITWTAHALWSDMHGPYAGDAMTAEFLRDRAAGHRIAGFYYHTVGILPYFSGNIFANQAPHAYWLWSTQNRTVAGAPFELEKKPDYAVVGGWGWGNDGDVTGDWLSPDLSIPPQVLMGDDHFVIPYFEHHGYHETHRFCGHTWMRGGYAELLCDVILEPIKQPPGQSFPTSHTVVQPAPH